MARWTAMMLALGIGVRVLSLEYTTSTTTSTSSYEDTQAVEYAYEGSDSTTPQEALYDDVITDADDSHGIQLASLQRTGAKRKTYAGARFAGDNTVFKREHEWGVKFDVLTVYRPIESVGYEYIKTEGKQLQLVTEINGSVSDIANGRFDSSVRKLAKAIAKKGTVVWIRQLHEFNSENTYHWCVYPYSQRKIATFKRAWRHLVNIYREEKAPVLFQLTYIAQNPHNDRTPFAHFYPGREYVDHVGVDIYVNPGSRLVSLKTRLQDNVYSQLSQFGKPIFIGEVSCTDKGLDKAKWIYDAWHDLAVYFPRITIVSWFLEDKGGKRQWNLHTKKEISAFVNGLHEFRKLCSHAHQLIQDS
ncbi:glycoside hydrolase superfamily [Tribonema minus]|uniref:Glycoside hydrolase superfamily n=1 Tax=Tribonema minus TaxID=303371 RepID=A0A836CLT1_9STRA|nr:glycoside hydrolase superfamily [Tribonema minus]